MPLREWSLSPTEVSVTAESTADTSAPTITPTITLTEGSPDSALKPVIANNNRGFMAEYILDNPWLLLSRNLSIQHSYLVIWPATNNDSCLV